MLHGHLNIRFRLFKNNNRMQGVGTGGGVKDGWKSEICSGMCIINMLSSGGGGQFVMYRCVNIHYHKLCAEKKMTKLHYY